MPPRPRSVPTLRLFLISGVLLGGCAPSKETLLPQDGPTMLEIYEGHLDGVGQGAGAPTSARAGACHDDVRAASVPEPIDARTVRAPVRPTGELAGYTREVHNEIDGLFPTLPNPTLVMYIFPHLAGEERLPVPGYATSFSMYPRTEFALPGEAAAPRLERTPEPPRGPVTAETLACRARAVPVAGPQ